MRIGIIADIHSNLEALEQALDILKTHAIDQVVCLGDIVGYGANPNECMAIVREQAAHILLGNHDQAAIDLTGADQFNPFALFAAQWTHERLTEDHKKFLRTLPYILELQGLFFVHASPYQPEEWHYILSSADARDNFDHFHQPVCFIGHSHVAGIFSTNRPADPSRRRLARLASDSSTLASQGRDRSERAEVEATANKGITIHRQGKYIINVGSIGQPRDADWRLSFGIFDTEDWTYQNIRAEYDVGAASQKILKAGLPRLLAERILVGR